MENSDNKKIKTRTEIVKPVKVKKTKKMREKKSSKRQNIMGYIFLVPWLIGFIAFTAYPFINTVYLSFFQVSQTVRGVETEFSGLDNYDVALFRNTDFVPALIDFALMEITYVPTITVISFILSLLLNRKIKFRSGFRAIYFLPVIVLSGPVMFQLADTGGTATIGISDMVLFKMVSNYSQPLAGVLGSLFENYTEILWFTGIPIVLFINALQKINPSVVEAATIDSATPWQILWKITIPIMRPTVLIGCIFTIVQIGMFSDNPVFNLISGAMANTSGGLGLASAFAWIYSFVILALIGLAFLLLRDPKESVEKEIKKREKKWGRI